MWAGFNSSGRLTRIRAVLTIEPLKRLEQCFEAFRCSAGGSLSIVVCCSDCKIFSFGQNCVQIFQVVRRTPHAICSARPRVESYRGQIDPEVLVRPSRAWRLTNESSTPASPPAHRHVRPLAPYASFPRFVCFRAAPSFQTVGGHRGRRSRRVALPHRARHAEDNRRLLALQSRGHTGTV